MKWSQLKSLIEARLAPELRGRVAYHSARYGQCMCGRFWITIDGQEVANLCTRAHGVRQHRAARESPPPEPPPRPRSLTEYGEFSRQQAYAAIWEFIHDLGIDDALGSANPLHRMLAVVDARVSRRRLEALDADAEHPLVRSFLQLRLSAGSSRRI